jgi:hypothetical protein
MVLPLLLLVKNALRFPEFLWWTSSVAWDVSYDSTTYSWRVGLGLAPQGKNRDTVQNATVAAFLVLLWDNKLTGWLWCVIGSFSFPNRHVSIYVETKGILFTLLREPRVLCS